MLSTYGASAPTLEDTFLKIVFVDCGRKYFSVDSLKKIIENAASSGFKYVELGVGNDGLRFLLDDMKLQVNGTEYSSEAVKNAIHAGNEGYYNFDTDELTESDMDTIIDYASQKKIGIIPLVNTPGHMDAILSAANSLTGSTCSYNGSARTIDVSNATAVAFTQALMQKYIDYFASKGCELFNMGADEYANDKYTGGSMGFGNLQDSGKYSYFVDYVNKMADMIKAAGMTPMAFNDGIYFNNKSVGTIDNSIVVCYWSNGWPGYTPRSAADLKSDGFRLVNTHGDYYWVLGKSGGQCSAEKASGFKYKEFQGGTIENPSGAMFCIWCDYPGDKSDSYVVAKTKDTIEAFGKTLPESVSESVKINESYNTNENKFTVGSSVTLTLSNNDKIVAYDSTDTSVVSLEGKQAEKNGEENLASDETKEYSAVVGTALKPGSSTITLTDTKGRSYTTELTVAADRNNPVEKNITVTVNSDYTETLEGDLTSEELSYDNSVVNVKTELQKENAETISYSASTSTDVGIWEDNTSDKLIDGNSSTYFWSNSEQAVGQYVQVDIGTAIPFNTIQLTSPSDENGDYCENADVLVSADGSKWTKIGSYTGLKSPQNFINNILPKVRYIRVQITTAKKNWWKLAEIAWGNTSGDGQFTRMDSQGTVTTEAKDQTLVTFTGIKEGETWVQIGTVKYKIKVVNENINGVEPITVEYWITNRKVVINENEEETSKEIKATDPNVYSETGAKVSDLLPNKGTIKDDKTSKTAYWKTTLLDTDHKQTEDKGVNQTLVGNDFIYIRYWRNKWSVSSNGNDWSEIEDTDQIVAYYLQVTTVTQEVATKVVDWGVNYKNYTPENFVMMDYAVKYQSGQRTPEKFPVDKTLAFHCDSADTTSVHYDDTLKEYYREIGLIKADETADYEVYMITMTPSSDKSNDYVGNSASSVTSCNYAGTEKVVWVDDEKDLGDFKNANLHAEGYHVGGEAIVPGVKITNKHAMLITYYVRAKVTDDSLQVRYIDKTTNTEFYQYNIAAKQGTTFKENIGLPEGGMGNLINGEVVNNTDGTQVVSSDLSTMPEIGADYRYSTYTCESVTTSEDKKIVTLYYTFDNIHKFVVDYGLPLVITSNDLGLNTTDWTSAEASTNKYGKVDLNSEKHTLTYTPSQVLPEVETINLNLIDNKTKKPATHIIYIYPATTVYYEETFVEKGKGAEELAVQTTSQCGNSSANYGFDNTYAVNGDNLNNKTLILTGTNEESFNFKGTGVDVYANTIAQENKEDTNFSGTMMVKVFKNDTIVKIVTVKIKEIKNPGIKRYQKIACSRIFL